MNSNTEIMGEYRNDRSLQNTQELQDMQNNSMYQNQNTIVGDASLDGSQFSTEPMRDATTTVEITQFHDTSSTVNGDADGTQSAIGVLDDIPSIAAFLRRPALIASETLSTSTPIQPIFLTQELGRIPMATYKVPEDVLKFGGKLDKIRNFRYFKGTCVFKFMTNANPFTQGRFWISIAPGQELRKCYRQTDKTLASLTSYPGIELDVQTNTSATLSVPFLAEKDAIETAIVESYAQVNVYSLCPISSPGLANQKLSFQVFAWIEDLELIGPTPLGSTVPNMRNQFNQTPSEKIQANLQVAREAKGPVEEISNKINTISDAIKDSPLGSIPLVGTAASAISWVSSAVSGVASIFGWSRPIDGSHSSAFVNVPGRGYGSTVAKDSSVALALSNENSIGEVVNNFPSTIDEMSLEYVCGRPAVVSTTQWLQNSAKNALITMLPVGPQIYPGPVAETIADSNRRQIVGTGASKRYRYDMTLFEYVASHFTHWRADLHYRITLTKTPFHSGRLEIFFVPGQLSEAEIFSAALADATNTYRQIIDITNQNEINISIPYTSPYVMSKVALDATIDNTLESRPIGWLVIRQLTPLIMPETVSPFVTVQVWKWASNVTFAGPTDIGLEDVITVAPPPPPSRGYEKVEANLEINVATDAKAIEHVVWGKENKVDLIAPSTVAGEKLFSLRSLIHAHRPMNVGISNNSLINTNVGMNVGGYVGRFSGIYAFYRGGLSYKFIPPSALDMTKLDRITSYLYSRSNVLDNSNRANWSMQHMTFPSLNPFHEIMVPFYTFTRRLWCNVDTPTPESAFSRSTCVQVLTSVPSLQGLVAAKDDFTFGYLIGCPTQTTTNAV